MFETPSAVSSSYPTPEPNPDNPTQPKPKPNVSTMRLLTILAGALALAPGALSVDVEKSILVTYNREAPRLSQLIGDAKDAILKAGGKITHEFKFIK